MTSPTGRDLGTAVGRIEIRVDSLREASVVAQQVAKEINAAFSSINGNLSNVAQIARAWSQAQAAQYRAAAAEAQASAKTEVAASNERIQAIKSETQIAIQASKERIAQLRQEQQERRQNQPTQPGQTGGAGQAYRFPTFIQFAAYPAGQLLSSFGQQGAATSVMTAGALAGLVDQLPLLGFQLRTLGERLTGLGGIVGTLANLGATAAGGLGATAAGLGAILAVAAPIVIVLAGVAAVLGNIAAAAKEAQDQAQAYVDKQNVLNALLEKGATAEDVQTQAGGEQRAFDSTRAALDALAPMMDIIRNAGILPQIEGAARGQAGATALAGLLPGVEEVNRKINEASQGQFTTATALVAAYLKLTEQLQDNNVAVTNTAAAAGNSEIAQNTLNAAFNEQAKAAVEAADTQRQLARMSVEQLQQRLANGQAEIAVIEQQGALATGKQYDIFMARLEQLDAEKALIEQLLPSARQAELTDFITKAQAARDTFDLQGGRTAEDRQIAAGDTALDRGTQAQRRAQDALIQRAQANEDFQRSALRSAEDYYDTRAKQERDYQQDALERQQDLQDKLAQIISDSRIKILEAAARLDARGVFEEQRRRDQQIADTREDAQKEQSQRAQAFAQQLADQREQYEKQRQRAEEDFALRIRREDAQRVLQAQRQVQDDALQDERQRRSYALQDQRRLEDFARQIVSLASHYVSLSNIQNAYQSIMQQSWGSFLANMAAQVNPMNLRGGYGGGGSTYSGSGGGGGGTSGINASLQGFNYGAGAFPSSFNSGVPFFDEGGVNLKPGLFFSTVPEMHIPLSKMASGGGGASMVHIDNVVLGDIGNRSDTDVIALIDRGFRTFFERGLARG